MELLNQQAEAISKLQQFKVGALFMEPGTGKTRTAYELVKSVPGIDYILWLTPFQTKINLQEEIDKCGGLGDRLEIMGIETLSSSDRTYLRLIERLENTNAFIVVDESLKIKNWDATRTQRIVKLGKLCQYKLILNGTPITRNLLDIWAQMEFLSDKILRMRMNAFKNVFCEYTTVTKRIGNRTITREFITKYHNVEYLYSLIGPYVYACDLKLLIGKQYHAYNYTIEPELKEQYKYLKEHYLDNEKLQLLNNNFYLELTQKMQHLYCCAEDKFTMLDLIVKANSPEKVIVYCKYVVSREEVVKRFPKVSVLSYGKHSYGLNLQHKNVIVYFDKTFDYGQRKHSEQRTYRTGQQDDCLYYDLTGDVKLEGVIDANIGKKTGLLEAFKGKAMSEVREIL